ncbi:hypothetical protein C7N43_05765 [Sphingobacteriales bacterium UPWRP_1]|nr:hypothetical protein BVG80_05535 [Sphingobacteriales bacterium TSM_CSM]PSJ77962.1 hypothetical protein C7N43_05765 [Sphingobacteriales bacterium UPWRP_1]
MPAFTLRYLLLVALLCFLGCRKEAGPGGNAAIRGNVHAYHYNSTFTVFIADYPAADEYVYIIYDNDFSYSDRVKTDYEGDFEFNYLYPGQYRIYVYSLDSTLQAPSGKIAVVKDITINGNKDIVHTDTLKIFK